jgi:septal ring factor EnvC (AmiA/AmiB activator)
MSVASSAASVRSVQFMGQEVTLDVALDRVVKGIQQRLNELEVALRNLAMMESGEQSLEDEDAEFKTCVALEDQTQDLVAGLIELAEELPDIASDIRGPAPSKESKSWFSVHKKERKAELARRKEAAKARAAAERQAALDARAEPGAAAAP